MFKLSLYLFMNIDKREDEKDSHIADVPEADHIASIPKPDYTAVRTLKRDKRRERKRDVPEST